MASTEGLWTKFGVLLGVYVCYQLLKALYRITLHPLAKFPGPKLAALSYKYEFYYDGIKDGSYTGEISRMHDRYGTNISGYRIARLMLHRSNREDKS
jgi:hypothetical protein